ncbi:MAG: hypothetical protein IJA83_10710 [Clostridia bacterium]|nr:hypothetical protein [Clostridia bacterium]
MFRTTDTPDVQANPDLLNNPYFYWHADFVVTFDKPVAQNSVTLAGRYDAWMDGAWIPYANPNAVAEGEEIRLLGEIGKLMNSGNPVYINYAELCAGIQKFICGAYDNDGQNAGTTMTVELRLYETKPLEESENNSVNEETGHYEVLGSFTHTF